MKIFLLLMILLPGQEPKFHRAEMPSAEICAAAAAAFLTEALEDEDRIFARGGQKGASCQIVYLDKGERV